MAELRSPIVRLQNQIAASPYRIAPEREAELGRIVEDLGLTISIGEGKSFDFWVGTESKEITTNIATLEFFWASAHAHVVLFDEYGKAQKDGDEQFDTGRNQRCKNALELLGWAVTNLNSNGDAIWPSHLPMPEDESEFGSDSHATTEIFLCGVAWIIHHEIAHIRRGHTHLHTSRSQDEEIEADRDATEWVLGQSSIAAESQKRTLGIATAILSMMGIENGREFRVEDSHPESFKRIFDCLDSASLEENDVVYAFCTVIMQIQLWYAGEQTAHEGTSHYDAFCSYLVDYARK